MKDIKKDYLQIINQKKNDTKKFNPYKLINSTFFYLLSLLKSQLKILDNKNFLI